MPHRLRDTSAGCFHVWTHCVWAAGAHYRDDHDRLEFLRHLARVTAVKEWRCIGFCLMGTHYHLVVEVSEGLLPVAMQSLNHAYAVHFNRRHGFRGHVQSRRYGSRKLRGGEELIGAYVYAMKNPVEAGLCTRASFWPWSSFGGTVGLAPPNSFVDDKPILACFEQDPEPLLALRRAVEKP